MSAAFLTATITAITTVEGTGLQYFLPTGCTAASTVIRVGIITACAIAGRRSKPIAVTIQADDLSTMRRVDIIGWHK
ncbi:MAG: hypothetical protein BroJett039_09990 [Chloroflexota bacterium]|nr:MAG: hypothetical protein BroJett039_09990 [Chloroflexota bacterium]